MKDQVKWEFVNRLRVAASSGNMGYPQAAHDARVALDLLDHFRADAEFLRKEKASAWGAVLIDPPAVVVERKTR